MRILHIHFLILCFVYSVQSFSWGSMGHRLVGDIAAEYLTEPTKKELSKILQKDSLADISTWPDLIKRKKKYRKYSPWHYCTVADGKAYKSDEKSGSLVIQLNAAINSLKESDSLSGFSKRETIAWLVHLVGDLHQPLHVGRPGDKGGNKIIVSWFDKKVNLHRLWDTEILERLSKDRKFLLKEIKKEFLAIDSFDSNSKISQAEFGFSGRPEDWANESVQFRKYPYDMLLGDEVREVKNLEDLKIHNKYLKTRGRKISKEKLPKLGEAYFQQNQRIVKGRIAQAGYRLAKLLNDIYDPVKSR